MQNIGMPITFSIPLEIPELDIIFWLRHFSTETLNTRYKLGYPYATLYLQKIVSYNDRAIMDADSKSALSFPITEYNIYDVKDMFTDILNWYSDDGKQLLYGRTDDGMLMFNSEYSKLNASFVNVYGKVKTVIKAVPTVVEIGNQVMEPGAVLYINRKANSIVLRENQIKKLCRFILDFNFIAYTNFALECFNHCMITGTLISREEVQRRLESQRQYNTNFRY